MGKPKRFMPAYPKVPAYGWVYPNHVKPPLRTNSCSWCGSQFVKTQLPSGGTVWECPHCDRSCFARPPCKQCHPDGTGT